MTMGAKNKTINVIQGDYAVSDDEETVLTTVLGSCVAACFYDPVARIGGMNHFLLPGSKADKTVSMSYGLNAMELLINNMLKKGARRQNFRAKLFGGANMRKGLTDIGAQNVRFAKEFLECEGIPCEAESLGGMSARRLRFWPVSGRAQLKIIGDVGLVKLKAEKPKVIKPDNASELELF